MRESDIFLVCRCLDQTVTISTTGATSLSIVTVGHLSPFIITALTSPLSSRPDIGLKFREEGGVPGGARDSRERITDSLRFHQLRKQSDLVLIRSVQEDTFHHKYFTKPPLHFITCFFLDPSLETEYRRTAWKANYSVSGEYEAEPTLASSSFNAYIDILVSMIVFLVVSGTCLVQYGLSPAWVSVCSLAGLYYGALVLVCCTHLLSPGPPASLFRKVYTWCRAWLPSQVRLQTRERETNTLDYNKLI